MGLFSMQGKMDEKLEEKSETEIFEEKMEVEDVPNNLSKTRADTVITKGITLSGALRGEGVIQVDGIIEGEIDLKGSLIVAPTGLVKGPVAADVIRIAGRVEGNVTAHKHLRLEKNGIMEGDLSTSSLVIEEGGWPNGRATMIQAQSGLFSSTEDMISADMPLEFDTEIYEQLDVGDED